MFKKLKIIVSILLVLLISTNTITSLASADYSMEDSVKTLKAKDGQFYTAGKNFIPLAEEYEITTDQNGNPVATIVDESGNEISVPLDENGNLLIGDLIFDNDSNKKDYLNSNEPVVVCLTKQGTECVSTSSSNIELIGTTREGDKILQKVSYDGNLYYIDCATVNTVDCKESDRTIGDYSYLFNNNNNPENILNNGEVNFINNDPIEQLLARKDSEEIYNFYNNSDQELSEQVFTCADYQCIYKQYKQGTINKRHFNGVMNPLATNISIYNYARNSFLKPVIYDNIDAIRNSTVDGVVNTVNDFDNFMTSDNNE